MLAHLAMLTNAGACLQVDEGKDTSEAYDKAKSKFSKMILRTLTHNKEYNADSVERFSTEKCKGDAVLIEQYVEPSDMYKYIYIYSIYNSGLLPLSVKQPAPCCTHDEGLP